MYSSVLGRFLSADTIVPQPENPQSMSRYTYGLNNPVKYTDPTGHYIFEEAPGDRLPIPGTQTSVPNDFVDLATAQRLYHVNTPIRESVDTYNNDNGHHPTDLEWVGTLLGVPGIALFGSVASADIAANGVAAAIGFGSYTVARGTISSLREKNISHFFDDWDPIDAALSTFGGIATSALPLRWAPAILGGQSVASDILHGKAPNIQHAAVNAAIGTAGVALTKIMGYIMIESAPSTLAEMKYFAPLSNSELYTAKLLEYAWTSAIALGITGLNDPPFPAPH
jgi:hypothetical protein